MSEVGFPQRLSEYLARINLVIDYIDSHLADELTLDELSAIAGFSKYHFHRIFFSFSGETLFQFIQRLRLERAANLLYSQQSKSITEIAYDCGFTNPSSFAKSFKKQFGASASAWRERKPFNSNLGKVESSIRQAISNHRKDILSSAIYTEYVGQTKTQIWRVTMNNNTRTVEVKELPDITLAYIRHVGPYKGDSELFDRLFGKLFQWAGARNLITPEAKSIIIYHDNPEITDEGKLRISVCVTVPESTAVDGEIGKMTIPAGKYAISRFTLTTTEFADAWNWLYGIWLPASGYTCDDRPCFEMYPNPGKENDVFTVDICIPVIPL